MSSRAARALDASRRSSRRYLENVAVVVEDEPTPDDCCASMGLDPRRDTLYGLYQGVPLSERPHDFAGLPDRITIFAGPLVRDFCARRRRRAADRVTVVHEIAHFFGLDETRSGGSGTRPVDSAVTSVGMVRHHWRLMLGPCGCAILGVRLACCALRRWCATPRSPEPRGRRSPRQALASARPGREPRTRDEREGALRARPGARRAGRRARRQQRRRALRPLLQHGRADAHRRREHLVGVRAPPPDGRARPDARARPGPRRRARRRRARSSSACPASSAATRRRARRCSARSSSAIPTRVQLAPDARQDVRRARRPRRGHRLRDAGAADRARSRVAPTRSPRRRRRSPSCGRTASAAARWPRRSRPRRARQRSPPSRRPTSTCSSSAAASPAPASRATPRCAASASRSSSAPTGPPARAAAARS